MLHEIFLHKFFILIKRLFLLIRLIIDDFLDEYDPIERMAEEIEQSYNTRFDEEFDEENDYYENDWFISKYFDS